MAKQLRPLEVAREGYLVGAAGAAREARTRVPHEALVACLAGLLDPDHLRRAFVDANLDASFLSAQGTLRAALRLLELIAWNQGVASWGPNHRPLDRIGHIPFFASE